ncbi:hypothetical protein MBLNU459_g0917t3 [Dothideomycetes sp. NU459]
MSGLIGDNANQFGRTMGEPDATAQGLLTSIYDIGCAVGCLLSFFIGERFGRKKMIMAGGSIMVLGTIILGSSYGRAQFYVGRVVTGLGNGINSSNVPAYQSEMARPQKRGALLCAQGTVTILGLCIAYWLDYGLSFTDSPAQWRFPISFQAFFAICLVIQMIPLPESPRWLLEHGKTTKATSILARLQYDQPADEDSEEVVMLRRQIETALELEHAEGPFRYSELLQGGRIQNFRRMILCALVNIMQQFTGSNMINYYAPVVYTNSMGLSRNLSLILGGCTSLTYFAGSFIPLWGMAKEARGTIVSNAPEPSVFPVMTDVVPRFYPSEVTTTRIRSKGQAFGGFINWMCVFCVVQITPIAIQNIQWRTFIIFACFCAAWVPLVYCFFPETNGLQLEDIDHLFEKGGITGGVIHAKGGRTVQPGYHSTHPNNEGVKKDRYEAMGIEHKAEKETTLEMGDNHGCSHLKVQPLSMHSFTSLLLASAGSSLVNAQYGNFGSPFPNTTYPGFESDNPVTVAGSSSFQESPPKYPSPWGEGTGGWDDAYRKARAFVSQLTLEEKVNLTTGTGWEQDSCVGQTGSIPRLAFAALCLQDSPTGVRDTDFVSVWPAGVNVAATWDRGLAHARGQGMGEEHRGKGVDMQLGPVAGPLGRVSEGGRNWEGFSPDPWLTGVMFAESIEGIQSAGVMASAKHFIAYEQEHFRQSVEAQQYGFNVTASGSANLDDITMHELYLWPFADGIRAGAANIMCSYNQVNNSQACQNSYTLNYLLKGELGFQGYVVSDWYGTHSGVSAILAGLDMSMPGDPEQQWTNTGASYFGANLTIAILNGTVPAWRLDDAAVRIMASYYFVGRDQVNTTINFNSWTKDTYGYEHYVVEQGWGLINQHVDVRGEHANLIREIGAKSVVLLKNVNDTLPLTGKEKLTAVFGEDAGPNIYGPNGCSDRGCDNGTLAMAWGSGSTDFTYLVTPDTAIQNEVVSQYGAYESILDNQAFSQIATLARRAEVSIVFVNSDSGEGYIVVDENFGDRNNLTLWQGGDDLINAVAANCSNTVVVIHSTGPVLIDQYKNHANITAIVWAGVPGEQSGNSIADVLYGRVNPGGKLPFTMPVDRNDSGTDILYTPNDLVPQTNFKEGVFIDYRAYDRNNIEPAYEFGFGLSYTTFKYSNLKIQKLNAGNYTPTMGYTSAAQTYGTISNDSSSHVFPANFTRVPLYLYPWLNSTNLSEASGTEGYGDNSFVPAGATDGSPQKRHPAGGAPGGNPELWDILYQVTATITNTGSVAGEEVPQLYVSLGGPYNPVRVLRGFERLSIQPNSSTTFTATLTRRDLSNWSPELQNWYIPSTNKTVSVGSSSRKLLLSAALP